MKKLFALLLSLALLLTLCACGGDAPNTSTDANPDVTPDIRPDVVTDRSSDVIAVFETEYARLELHGYHVDDAQTGNLAQLRTVADNQVIVSLDGIFTNRKNRTIDIQNTYVVFGFGNRQYEGIVVGYQEGSTELNPLLFDKQNTKCHVFTVIPEEILTETTAFDMQIGFTEDFSPIQRNGDNLPDFDKCDAMTRFTVE